MGKGNRTSSPQLERGSILHEIYEAYNTNPDKFEQYVSFIEESSDHEEYEKNLYGFFWLLEKYGLDRADYSELEIMDEGLNLKGIIDAIYVKKMEGECSQAEFVLIDYKTGKFNKTNKKNYMIQLYIYEHIANNWFRQRNGNANGNYIDRIGLFFTAFPEESFIVEVNDKKRERYMGYAYEVMDKIKNDDFTGVGKLCKWCQFATQCDDYSDEIITQTNDHVLMVV